MRVPRLALCTLALVAVASTAHAQQPDGPPGGGRPGRGMMMQRMKDDLVSDLERQRKNVLDYLNAAPDSMMRFRTTPGVRTFAQQIFHAAAEIPVLVGGGLGVTPLAEPSDTARLFSSKAALRDYVNAAYDFGVKAVRDADAQAFMTEKTIFGMTRTGTRWVHGALEHGTWTLGQTVPYLRMNKVTPPDYLPF